MKTSMLSALVLTLFFVFSACNSEAQTTKGDAKTSTQPASEIQLIQFHSSHRCKTCLMIEENAKATAKNYPNVSFKLLNVDDKKNEKLAATFEAAGTALFLYNPKTGKKVELTDFAFMNATNKAKFIKELGKKIDAFK